MPSNKENVRTKDKTRLKVFFNEIILLFFTLNGIFQQEEFTIFVDYCQEVLRNYEANSSFECHASAALRDDLQ